MPDDSLIRAGFTPHPDTKKVIKEYQDARKALLDVDDANKKVAKSGGQTFDDSADDARQTKVEVKKLNSAIEDYEARLKSVKGAGADLSGDIASSTAGLRGAIDFLSGGQATALAGSLELAEAFADIGEFAPIAATQLKAVAAGIGASLTPSIVKLSVNIAQAAPILGTMAASAYGLVAPLSATAAGFVAVAIPIAAVAAPLAIAVAAFQNMRSESAKLAKTLEAQLEAQRTVQQSINEGLTSSEAEERISKLKEQIAQEESLRTRSQEALNKAYSQATQGDVFRVVFGDLAVRIRDEDDVLHRQIEKSSGIIADYRGELKALENALKNNATATNDAKVAEEDRTKALEQAQVDLTAIESQRTQRLVTLAGLEAQYDSTLAASTKRREQLLEDRALTELEKEEDFAIRRGKALSKHLDDLYNIEQSGLAKVKEFEGVLDSLPSALAEAQGVAQTKANDAIGKVNAGFMASELKAVERFRDAESKATKDYNKQRVRAIQDLYDKLNDAQRENNVISFLQAQRDGKKTLNRQREDFDDNTRERQKAFDSEREQAVAAREARIAEIQTGLAQEIAELRKNSDAKRAELEQSIKDEKTAIQQKTKASEDAFKQQIAEEDAERQRQADRQLRRQEIQDGREESRLQEALAGIEQKRLAEQAALSSVIAKAYEFQAVVDNINVRRETQINNAVTAAQKSIDIVQDLFGKKTPTSPTSTPFGAFADGGIVTRPTLGLIGERGPEAIIPLSRRGGSTGRGMNLSPNININMTVGDIASGSQVRAAIDDAIDAINEGFATFVMGSLAGNVA